MSLHGPFETLEVWDACCCVEGCEELPTDSRGYCRKHVEDILQGNPNIGGTDPWYKTASEGEIARQLKMVFRDYSCLKYEDDGSRERVVDTLMSYIDELILRAEKRGAQKAFRECPECAAMPGSPVLCSDCLWQRDVGYNR